MIFESKKKLKFVLVKVENLELENKNKVIESSNTGSEINAKQEASTERNKPNNIYRTKFIPKAEYQSANEE